MLDCNNVFVDSVNRQVSLMESGNVEGGASLVPHLFQFLVMLATDSRLVSIPEVLYNNYNSYNKTCLYWDWPNRTGGCITRLLHAVLMAP